MTENFGKNITELCYWGFNSQKVFIGSSNADTVKLTGPRTLANKRWVGPVKLLCMIMFSISKIRPKSILGMVKAQKFLRCLVMASYWIGIKPLTELIMTTHSTMCNHSYSICRLPPMMALRLRPDHHLLDQCHRYRKEMIAFVNSSLQWF